MQQLRLHLLELHEIFAGEVVEDLGARIMAAHRSFYDHDLLLLEGTGHAGVGSVSYIGCLLLNTRLGIDVTHLYGLTETFGPAVICDWRPDWNALPIEKQAQIKARQGVELQPEIIALGCGWNDLL